MNASILFSFVLSLWTAPPPAGQAPSPAAQNPKPRDDAAAASPGSTPESPATKDPTPPTPATKEGDSPANDPGKAPSGPDAEGESSTDPAAAPTGDGQTQQVVDPGAAQPAAIPPGSLPPGPPEGAGGPAGLGAEGGAGLTPLPPPPSSQDPTTIARGPWRGRFWFGARLDLVAPLGGSQPSKGHVVAVGGAFLFGWRVNNWLGLHTGLSTVAHSAEKVRLVDAYGNVFTGVEYGQLLGFEFLGGRFYWPLRGRFQPYLDVTGGMALLFLPGRSSALVGGFGLAGIGFDGWVSRNFTLGLDVDYRLMGFGPVDDDENGSLGHGLRAGAHLGVHW